MITLLVWRSHLAPLVRQYFPINAAETLVIPRGNVLIIVVIGHIYGRILDYL